MENKGNRTNGNNAAQREAAAALGALLDALDVLGLPFDLAEDLPALAGALARLSEDVIRANPMEITMVENYLETVVGGGEARFDAAEQQEAQLRAATWDAEAVGAPVAVRPHVGDLTPYLRARRQMSKWRANMLHVCEAAGINPTVLDAEPDDPTYEALRGAWHDAWVQATTTQRPSSITYRKRANRWLAFFRDQGKVVCRTAGTELPAGALGEPNARNRILVMVGRLLCQWVGAGVLPP